MRWPRIALAALGAAATAAALAVQPPQTFAFTGIAGIAAFVLAAGCLAADMVPYRPLHALAAVLSLPAMVVLGNASYALYLFQRPVANLIQSIEVRSLLVLPEEP